MDKFRCKNKILSQKNLIEAGIIVVAVLALFLPDGNACIYKRIFGIPCPGCGMTRAYISLFKFEFAAAFFYHPLFFLPPVFGLLFIFKDVSMVKSVYTSNTFWLTVAIIVIIVYACRMLTLFPKTEPMDFNSEALFPSVLNLIQQVFLLVFL